MSANGHLSERMPQFVDLRLQCHVHNLPTDLLRKQDAFGFLPPKTFIYTNISHRVDIQACWKFLKKGRFEIATSVSGKTSYICV